MTPACEWHRNTAAVAEVRVQPWHGGPAVWTPACGRCVEEFAPEDRQVPT